MTNFSSLLKSGSGGLDKLRTAVKSSDFSKGEEGYWKLTVDKAGNGSAIVRFLPAVEPETVPFQAFYRHGFKSPTGQWYIELSRTTIGENDPCSEWNNRLWSTNDTVVQAQVSVQKRKKTFVSNIYIVKDPGAPDNEGKVFLFRYGQKIFDKIKKAIEPEFNEDPAFDPFHVIDGANFKLRQKKVGGFPNYDDSNFESQSPLLKGDETAIVSVLQQVKSLTDIVAPDKFKSYAELKKRLDSVMGFDTAQYLNAQQAALGVGSVSRAQSQGASTPSPSATEWTPASVDVDDDAPAGGDRFGDD